MFSSIFKHHKGGKQEFQNYMRTDGITCSLVFSKQQGCGSSDQNPKERKTKASEAESDRIPIVPQPGQRIVAIDPCQRDMIAAFSPGECTFKVSLKSYKHAAKTSLVTSFTTNPLERTTCPDGQSLKSKLEFLPSRRVILEWSAYLSLVTPLLPTIFGAYKAVGVRRWKFGALIFRDRTLDRICQRCCLGKFGRRSSDSLPTLVAFGAANSCSTGFGYAPAPQARLRRRMEKIHGAYVCLIDEFHTSRCCSCLLYTSPSPRDS